MSYMRRTRDSVDPVLLLIGLNVLMYVLTLVRPDLMFTLGLKKELLPSEPWTALTSMFVHANLYHILANMITLYFFGNMLRQIVSEKSFYLIYFVGGLTGSLFFWLLAPAGSIGVGASGAIFGLAGTLAVLRPNVRVIAFPLPVPVPLWGAVIGSFVILSFIAGVAWQAHLGGLLVGLVTGYAYKSGRRF